MRTLLMLDTIDRQRQEIWRLRQALEIVAKTSIHRDPIRNAVWLAGYAAEVQVIEFALDWKNSLTPWMQKHEQLHETTVAGKAGRS